MRELGAEDAFQPPRCPGCGWHLHPARLRANPLADVRAIDWRVWYCLGCERRYRYDWDQTDQESFRAHIGLLRDAARHAYDATQAEGG